MITNLGDDERLGGWPLKAVILKLSMHQNPLEALLTQIGRPHPHNFSDLGPECPVRSNSSGDADASGPETTL